jgi:hypothetical protein
MLDKVRSKLTYPYVASTLALFLALTGGAFALQGKNTVDGGDIVKNSVKSSDIKSPNGVKSGDIADNKVTGTDVEESSLGKVPSATNADTATNATNATNAVVAGDVLTKVAPGDPGVPSPAGAGFFDVVNLALPTGSYVIMGKASIDNDNAAAVDQLDCRILVNTDEDRIIDALEIQSAADDDTDTIALNLPVTITSPASAILQCNNPIGGAGDIEVHFGRLTALPVRSVTSVAFP